MSRTGIMGGTFDPIHLGHLITALYVKEIRKLDKIIFIPAYISPHKTDYNATAAGHRINMLQLAVENTPGFEISDYEISKKGISYTVDTLNYLSKENSNLELIIGYDNLLSFDTWKNPDEIIKVAKLIVLGRKTAAGNEVTNKYFEHAEMVNTPIIEISGTEIRGRVRDNKPLNYLVPQKVKEYIYTFNLYKD